jgi:hypothetical protein
MSLLSVRLTRHGDRRRADRCRSGAVAAFRTTISGPEIHDSGRRHGVADDDILHAIDHALAFEDAGEDPDHWVLIGPDTAGYLLEVVVMITTEGNQLVIHAMPMREKYRRLLGL